MADDHWGFYVEEHCCTSCGLPHGEAPEFVGWHVDPGVGCCIRRQPTTPGEVEQLIGAMDVAELACFRYRGGDPLVQLRIRARGHGSQIDTAQDLHRQRVSPGPCRDTPPEPIVSKGPVRNAVRGRLVGWLRRLCQLRTPR